MYITFDYGTLVQRSTSDEPPSMVKRIQESYCLSSPFIVMYITFHYGTPVQRSTSDEPPPWLKEFKKAVALAHLSML